MAEQIQEFLATEKPRAEWKKRVNIFSQVSYLFDFCFSRSIHNFIFEFLKLFIFVI